MKILLILLAVIVGLPVYAFVGFLVFVAATKMLDGTEKVAEWQYKTMTVPGGKGQTYAKWHCTHCKTKRKDRTKFCPECGYRMKNGGHDA